MKQHILTIGTTLVCILLLVMIVIGADGKALKPKREVFTFAVNSKLPQDPRDYLKGVINKERIHMDLSHVDTHTPGIYEIKATQSSRVYKFQIKIES